VSEQKVRAVLTLLPTSEGGLENPVLTGSPSLLFTFQSDGGEVQVGGSLRLESGDHLEPGQTAPVVFDFWHDEGLAHAAPGVEFGVWHGRTVGHGRVLELV
jgi:hypothetical protein